ncbi:MAG: cyclic nucleotide-binding domain-containing protein [Spirochaetales bacterium]|nr:cyclic nucleotide-binding domain-containing protein [Spirochaetales bacterium]
MEKYFLFIKNVYFFQELTDEEIYEMLNLCQEKTFNKKSIVFEEGSPADNFYIVIQGNVEVWKDYYKSKPDLLAKHGPGHLFGEMALIDDLPRSATIVADAGTLLLEMNKDGFNSIIQKNSTIALSVMKSISSMVRKSNDSFVEGLRQRNIELEKANEELKAAQVELIRSERLSALGKFSSLILHDIRNPLSILRGYAEMILFNLKKTDRIEKNANRIIKEADRINNLANELLDYSRGEIRLNISLVKIKPFVDEFIENIIDRFSASGITIQKELQFHGNALFDKERMMRVFLNLANNSLKAMQSGGTFSIKVFEKKGYLYFQVCDTGEGMAPEVVSKIFEPFTSFSKKGGTGLGMSIVKSIIDTHNGFLQVTSEEGKGSCFEIGLPLDD